MTGASRNVLGKVLAGFLFSFSGATVAVAQTDPQGAADRSASATSASDEIVVTAQRRSENVQDVPIAITAITPLRAEQLGITNMRDVQLATPGLTVSSGINYVDTTIRGVGSHFVTPGLEPAVATYIDGAYLERGFGSLFDVVDPGSIQVLKGPQGTLWGRNASGGAILINTADPEYKFGGRVFAEVGSLDHSRVEGMVNTPLSDTVAARFAVRYNKDGGYVRNLPDGFMYGGRENWTVRGKLAFEPSDNLSAVLQVQYDKTERTPGANAEILPNGFCVACGGSTYTYPLTDPYTTANNVVNGGDGGRDESSFVNLKVKRNFGNISIESVSAYRDMQNFETGDFDFSDVDVFNIVQDSGSKTFTQELTASSDFDGMFNFIAGVSYVNDKSNFALALPTLADYPNYTKIVENEIETESISGFAEATVKLLPRLTLTGGGRFTQDDRSVVGLSDKVSFDGFTPRFVIAYEWGPANLYISYNEGFKSGGFSTPVFGSPATVVDPEEIKSYEAGVKFTSDDRRLHVNLAAFTYDYTDLQVTIINSTGFSTLENAASASGKGFELEFDYQPNDVLQLFGAVSYLKNEFEKYASAQVQLPVYDAGGNPAGILVGTEDLSGFQMQNSPEWTAFLGATVEHELVDGWRGSLTGFVRYTSDYDFSAGAGGPLRADRQEGYTTAKLSGTLTPQDERFELGFYVENLTDEVYSDYQVTTAFGAMQYVARPRTYGVRLSAKF